MSPDFWKQFEGAPRVDCVRMKHEAQAKIHEETKDMTWEERRRYYARHAAAFRRANRLLAGRQALLATK